MDYGPQRGRSAPSVVQEGGTRVVQVESDRGTMLWFSGKARVKVFKYSYHSIVSVCHQPTLVLFYLGSTFSYMFVSTTFQESGWTSEKQKCANQLVEKMVKEQFRQKVEGTMLCFFRQAKGRVVRCNYHMYYLSMEFTYFSVILSQFYSLFFVYLLCIGSRYDMRVYGYAYFYFYPIR